MTYSIANSDIVSWAKSFDGPRFHACFCDPPYELGFMGKKWDSTGVAFRPETWTAVSNCLHPGAYLLAFGGTRTFHRLACAIEDAGFEIRDTLMWVYGSGFPKSLDVSKAIDKCGGESVSWFGEWLRGHRAKIGISQKELADRGGFFDKVNHGGSVANWELGYGLPTPEQFNKVCELLDLPFTRMEEAEREVIGRRKVNKGVAFTSEGPDFLDVTKPACDPAKQWNGYGTALKPAYEPIILARKPIEGTVASNVLKYGCGGINIDGCRVEYQGDTDPRTFGGEWRRDKGQKNVYCGGYAGANGGVSPIGRFPANLIHDGSQMVLELFPANAGASAPVRGTELSTPAKNTYGVYGRCAGQFHNDAGSAARFFYCAKASRRERDAGCENIPAQKGRHCYDPQYHEGGGNLPARVGNHHPTVKPISLCAYLSKLVLPPIADSRILVPFSGSGSEMIGCHLAGWSFAQGVEKEREYIELATSRLDHWTTK